MIYANQDITASSNPAQSVYTVVIAGKHIGAGATDGATQKGVMVLMRKLWSNC